MFGIKLCYKKTARSFKGTCFIIVGKFEFNIPSTKTQSFFAQAFNIAVNISEYLCVLNADGKQEAQDIAMHFTFSYYYKKHSWRRQNVSLHISVFLSFHAEKSINSTILQSGVTEL